MNIYEKLSRITMEIATVAKNLQVETGGGKGYKAVSEGDVLAAVKPIEAKYGVYSFPAIRRIVDSGEIVTTKTYKGELQETKRLFLRVETVYRFVNIEKPEEIVDVTVYGDGVDTQDKAPGKAMTYADKYALLKAYKIQTGDDPDRDASEDLKSIKPKEQRAGVRPTDNELMLEIRRTGMNLPQYLAMNSIQSLRELDDLKALALYHTLLAKPDKRD